MYLTKPV